MRFHVLGLGPIGSLLAHHLRKALPSPHSITLIHRTQVQSRLSQAAGDIKVEYQGAVEAQRGFEYDVFETFETKPTHNTPDRESLQDGERPKEDVWPIESLFVTTKAQQTVPAIQRLLPRINSSSAIVLLQNGMGVYEQLLHDHFPNPNTRPHFILASNTHGAWLKSRTTPHVVHAGSGKITFGIVPDPLGRDYELGVRDESVPEYERKLNLADIANPPVDHSYARYLPLRNTVAALLAMDTLNTQWRTISEMQVEIRRKLVINSVVNPLTAIMGVRNGDIFGTRQSQQLVARVCREASAVFRAQMQAEAAKNQGKDERGAETVSLPFELHGAQLRQSCLDVAQNTAGNISSMLSDLLRGSRQSEIEYMNGYLLKLGKMYKVPMPATATLRELTRMRFAIPLDQRL
jgi:2-dehydropantoate 2-reductase